MGVLRQGWAKALLLVSVVAGTAALVFGIALLRNAVSGGDQVLGGTCDLPVRPAPAAYLSSSSSGTTPEVKQAEYSETRNFERSREPVTIRTEVQLAAGVDAGTRDINVRVGPFERSDGVELASTQMTAYATVTSKAWRDVVEVVLCIDPVVPGSDPEHAVRAPAGSYRGTVFIDDRRVSGGAVTYTVNLKYEHRGLVILCVAGAGLLGAFVGSLLATGLDWSLSKANVLRALATGVSCVAALYAVYQAQYAKDPSWLGNDAMFTTLVATCVGAAYAATNFSGSVDISRAQPPQEPAKPGHPTQREFLRNAGL